MTGITKKVNVVYETSDGKGFKTLKDAEAHQQFIESTLYFKVRFGSDLNEGRHILRNYGYIKVEGCGEMPDKKVEKLCVYFCNKLFGDEYSFIQGHYISTAFIPMWSIEKCSIEEAFGMDMVGRVSLDENDEVFMQCDSRLHYSFGDMKKVINK